MSHTVARSQSVVQKEASRLSSGRRLTSAADNSAGKAVEVQLEARVRSRKVAQRNTEHARTMCKTALGGLNQIQESLLRLETLTVQAANGSISDKERVHLQSEVDNVLTGIDDIAFNTRLHDDQPLLNKVPIDIGFLIDRSGSMSDEIDAVKAQIDSFADNVIAKGYNVAFGLATAGGNDNLDATVMNADIGSPDFKTQLNSMSANQPMGMEHYSTLINAGVTDHPGTVDPDKFGWRSGAQKYLVLVTDTRAQEHAPLLPGNPSQADVASQLDNEGITVHVIGNLGRAADYTAITNLTEGSYSNIFPDEPGEDVEGAVGQALTSIENEIEAQLEAVSEYVFQTGVDSTTDDRVQSGVSLDVTKLGLEIDDLIIGTQEEAMQSLDNLSVAFDNLNQAFTTYATLENKFDRLIDNTSTMIESETQSLANLKDTDFADSSATYAMAKIRNETSMNVLKLYGDMKTGLINNLLDSMTRSVRGGMYSAMA
jgi:flagellin